jgi:CspA family cold shock protein
MIFSENPHLPRIKPGAGVCGIVGQGPSFYWLSSAVAGTRRGRSCGCASVLAKTLETKMATGKVKWFNPTKGYGFIQPTGGGQDVFVHISAVERAGLSTLNENQTVEFEIVSNRGKNSAENLKVK